MNEDNLELMVSYGLLIPICVVVILGCPALSIVISKGILREIKG